MSLQMHAMTNGNLDFSISVREKKRYSNREVCKLEDKTLDNIQLEHN